MSTLQYVREIFKERISQFTQDVKKSTEIDPYLNLQKSVVLQESRCFNDPQINDRKCRQILTRLIYLINQGEQFNQQEAQGLFFAITKLFQSNNFELRRLIYLMIKEFRDETSQYIVISSLSKDITSKQDLFRMNALRTIPTVLEPSNLVQIERYMKTAIIDKNQAISSAALLAGIQILRINTDIVRKWANEIQDRLNSKYPENNYHAIILLHEIKRNDAVTFTKILLNLTKENLVPIATVQIIRFIKEAITSGELEESFERLFLEYLLRSVHKSQEMVIFEASKALCEIKSLGNKELQPMAQVLNVFLISANNINKFVALKLINKLITNPIRRSLIQSTTDIESLIHDNNKSLSSLAVSILLKICKEDNIEKLLGQIYEYLSEMSDEFKIDILRSVRALVHQNPKKWKATLAFLSQTLKCDASQDFKRYAVDIVEGIIAEISDAREAGIVALSDYIEDCQFSGLQLHILSILNREASKKQCTTKIIRIINNRIHLEEAEIRAAAVGVLGKFALNYPEMKEKVTPLIRNTRFDPDEEVRNRGAFYLSVIPLEEKQSYEQFAAPISAEELDQLELYLHNNLEEIQKSEEPEVLTLDRAISFAASNKTKAKRPAQIPQFTMEEQIQKQQFSQEGIIEDEGAFEQDNLEKQKKIFKENIAFQNYGPLRKINKAADITDSKAEYLVSVTKYFFDEYFVFDFKVKNSLDNITLIDVSVDLNFKNENLSVHTIVPALKIDPETSSNIQIGVHMNPELRLISSSAAGILTFTVKEFNLQTGKLTAEYKDEYQLEDFNIRYNDFFSPVQWFKRKFKQEWEAYAVQEQQQTFQLDYKNIDIAIKEVIKHFGLLVCENTDVIVPQNKYHTLLLTGKYLNIASVLLICLIGFDQKYGCILKLTLKTDDELLSKNMFDTFS